MADQTEKSQCDDWKEEKNRAHHNKRCSVLSTGESNMSATSRPSLLARFNLVFRNAFVKKSPS